MVKFGIINKYAYSDPGDNIYYLDKDNIYWNRHKYTSLTQILNDIVEYDLESKGEWIRRNRE